MQALAESSRLGEAERAESRRKIGSAGCWLPTEIRKSVGFDHYPGSMIFPVVVFPATPPVARRRLVDVRRWRGGVHIGRRRGIYHGGLNVNGCRRRRCNIRRSKSSRDHACKEGNRSATIALSSISPRRGSYRKTDSSHRDDHSKTRRTLTFHHVGSTPMVGLTHSRWHTPA